MNSVLQYMDHQILIQWLPGCHVIKHMNSSTSEQYHMNSTRYEQYRHEQYPSWTVSAREQSFPCDLLLLIFPAFASMVVVIYRYTNNFGKFFTASYL
jgi:hypothetical protein